MKDAFIDSHSDIRDKIGLHLKAQERSIGWLAKSVKMSPSHFVRMLNKERPLTARTLDKINEVLKTAFTL